MRQQRIRRLLSVPRGDGRPAWPLSRRVLALLVLSAVALCPCACGEGPAIEPSPASVAQPQRHRPAVRDPNRPTLAVAPFLVYGDIKAKDANLIVPEHLLPLFADDYRIVDREQLSQFVRLDDLQLAGLMEVAGGKVGANDEEAIRYRRGVKLHEVRYLVGGSISVLPRSGLAITARITDWHTGAIREVAEVRGDDWEDLLGKLPELAARLQGKAPPGPETPGEPLKPPPNSVNILFQRPPGASLVIDKQKYRITVKGASVYLTAGKHPFELKIPESDTLYGVVNVLVVDEVTRTTPFGVQDVLFKDAHLAAARQGRPVLYQIWVETPRGRKIAIEYRLGLRPMD